MSEQGNFWYKIVKPEMERAQKSHDRVALALNAVFIASALLTTGASFHAAGIRSPEVLMRFFQKSLDEAIDDLQQRDSALRRGNGGLLASFTEKTKCQMGLKHVSDFKSHCEQAETEWRIRLDQLKKPVYTRQKTP